MDNAADQAAIDRKRGKAQELVSIRRVVLTSLMSQVNGRKYVWHELAKCNVFSQTLSFGRDGYASTAFAEGRRSLGLELMADITRYCPNEYLMMTRENSSIELEETNETPE